MAEPEERLGEALRQQGLTLAVAESCTGGLMASLITDVPGSSDYFLGGVVAYSNEVKKSLLGVSEGTLRRFGAVSEETALEMSAGVMEKLGSDVAASITGIAGPGGGTQEKPVGTVYISVTGKGMARGRVKRFSFNGARKEIKRQAALAAIEETMGLLMDREQSQIL